MTLPSLPPLPTVGADLNLWGTKNNAYLAAMPNAFSPRLTRAPRSTPLGEYRPLDSTFPTIGSWSSANAATAISGTTTTVYAGEVFATWRGTWASGTSYAINDVVGDATVTPRSWVALNANSGITPGTDPTMWRVAAPDARFSSVATPLAHARQIPAGLSTFHNGVQNLFQVTETGQARDVAVLTSYTGAGALELLVPGAGGKLRLTIDGVLDSTGWRSIPTGSQEYRLPITFANGVDTHILLIEVSTNSAFTGVTMLATDTLAPIPSPSLPVVVLIGDSIGAGQNLDGSTNGTNGAPVSNRMEAFPYHLARRMRWNVIPYAEGGTGLLNPGNQTTNPGFSTGRSRLPLVATLNPTATMCCLGLNDQSTANAAYTQTANQAETELYLQTCLTLMPRALHFMVGPFFTNDQASNSLNFTNIKAVRDGQLAAFTARGAVYVASANAWVAPNGLVYIDTLPVWLSGIKGTGGSANVLLSGEGIHPNLFGTMYYANRIAAASTAVLDYLGRSDLL